MVAQQQTAAVTPQIHSTFDTMQPLERRQLQTQIYNAKNYGTNIDLAVLSSLTPEFQTAVNKEIEEFKAQKRIREATEKANRRIRNNNEWDAGKQDNKAWINQQPTERYSDKTIGKQGYKWQRNFHAKNGNWYAQYQPVRGGTNYKYYDISTEEWDDYPVRVHCDNGHNIATMTPIQGTVCPDCGSTNITRGLYYQP